MIRPGRPADAGGIGALFDAYRMELAAAGRPESRDAATWGPWLDRRISAGDVRVVVEEEDVVGYIAWALRAGVGRRVLSVTDLYVLPRDARRPPRRRAARARARSRARRRRRRDRGHRRPGR